MAGDSAWEREDAWGEIVEGLRTGNPSVIRHFCRRYGSSLERLAERHLASGMRRRVGADDVVQSACRTFLRRAQIGEFELSDCEGLWGLLCAITLTKVREQTRYHLRGKRGLDREVHGAGHVSGEPSMFFDQAAAEPSPAEAAEFTDQFTQLIASLDEEGRQLVDLKLQQFTNEEIAVRLGCSERTVRRILKRVQESLARHFS